MIPASAQVSALEPSWALRYSEAELRGLLVLAALFNERLFVHDTQVADHVTLLNSFVRHHDAPHTLYSLLRDLFREGIARLCLRSSFQLSDPESVVPIDNLSDVHARLAERSSFGWVPQPGFAMRAKMLADLDHSVANRNVLRYEYGRLKEKFRASVREMASTPATQHFEILSRLPVDLRREYDELISKKWFTFISIIELFGRRGMRLDSLAIQSHGLLDELCYADWNRARLIGDNSRLWVPELDVAPVSLGMLRHAGDGVIELSEQTDLVTLIRERALRSTEAPGLALLGTLAIDDILALREAGASLSQLRDVPADIAEIQRRVIDGYMSYWRTICDYLRKHREPVARDSTRIAVFLRRHLPTISHYTSKTASFAIDLGVDALGLILPGLALSDESKKRLRDLLSLRFLFVGDSAEMKSLMKAIPAHSWLVAHQHSS